MNFIVVSDEEDETKQPARIVENSVTNNDADELIAIELEITEIDEQMHRLRYQRSGLVKRQQKLKQAAKQNRPSTTTAASSMEQWRRTDFPWSAKVDQVRSGTFKINAFREWQLETINVALSNLDCILIMPTGGGKSLCYQLPALISEGITIVVSPLISLVEDQIYALRNLQIDARSLNTSTPRPEQTEILHILDGKKSVDSTMKILYLTPEKIAKSKTIMSKLQKLYETKRFARLIVDEVHCVSQFGHDFRPDYKYLSIFKRQFPNVSILGLTATATLKVIDDIRQILKIPHCTLFRAPFNRKNLFYEVLHKSDVGKDAFNDLVQCIQHRFDRQSGIVYCLSQKDAEDVCFQLQRSNIKAGCYHAGLVAAARSQVHERWLKGQVHVICATIAFGMGIDKPDVRFVIHHSLSKSIENFYQESGRAGRDDQTSHCILFFRFGDVFRLAPMAFSDKSGHGLTNLYSMISYCLNESQCRRKLIAKYFDEVWQSNDCNQMCDICSRPSTGTTRRNCREEAAVIVECLEINCKQRFTPLKLIDQLAIKTMSKTDLQRLLLQMIVDQYLKEDFHFTPYTTICYVVPGSRANCVRNANWQITLDVTESIKKRTTTTTQVKRASVTKGEPKAKPIRTKKRPLEYDEDDDNEDDEDKIPLAKKQSKSRVTDALSNDRASTVEDDELDFF